VPIFLRSG